MKPSRQSLRTRNKAKAAYRSKFEKRIASALSGAGVSFSYENMRLKYTKVCHYTPDFILGNGVVLEVKGFWKPSDRTKHLMVRRDNPKLDIRFVFQRAKNTLSKKSKTTYGDWCDKHGFLWCEREIPISWLQ